MLNDRGVRTITLLQPDSPISLLDSPALVTISSAFFDG